MAVDVLLVLALVLMASGAVLVVAGFVVEQMRQNLELLIVTVCMLAAVVLLALR
jgi:hypothetical protein